MDWWFFALRNGGDPLCACLSPLLTGANDRQIMTKADIKAGVCQPLIQSLRYEFTCREVFSDDKSIKWSACQECVGVVSCELLIGCILVSSHQRVLKKWSDFASDQ
jgi:hypothetical protein